MGSYYTWVSEFVVEDLPLSRTAALVPKFAVKDLPLGRILMTMMMMIKKKYFPERRSGPTKPLYRDILKVRFVYLSSL